MDTCVILHGITGKVGSVIANNLREPDIDIVAGISRRDISSFTATDGMFIPVYPGISQALKDHPKANVVLDFTNAEACWTAFEETLKSGLNFVSGTSGLSDDTLQKMELITIDCGLGAIWVPNSAIGAVVMMFVSEIMARFTETADVIEGHHEKKLDAPSGTAVKTAERIAAVKPFRRYPAQKIVVPGVQGGEIDGVGIHALRIPGLVADQAVVFGMQGQTLGVWHHTIGRECYVPGVILALRSVAHLKGFMVGLEPLLGLHHTSAVDDVH